MARIDNRGGSYDKYHRDPVEFSFTEETKTSTYISGNKFERKVAGLPLGDGTYLHEGLPQEKIPTKLASDVELPYKTHKQDFKSRVETEASFREVENYKNIEATIMGGMIDFDNTTGKAELVVRLANGQKKVVKKSLFEIASWLMNESAKGIIDNA